MKNLKIILSVVLFTFIITNASASNLSTVPLSELSIIDNESISLVLENNADEVLFTEITYCETKKRLCFKSIMTIEFVQILDNKGQIVYQLPVEIAKLHLALSTFDEGDYTVNLKLEGKEELVSSAITRK